ncbi:MAG: hypothetical protein U0793_02130 [Gemmataceae bacterium]
MINAGARDLFLVHAWRFHDDWKRLAGILDEHDVHGWRNFSLPWHDPAIDPRSPRGRETIQRTLEAQIIPVHAVLLLEGVWREPGVRAWIELELDMARRHGKPVIAVPAWGAAEVSAELRDRADTTAPFDAAAVFEMVRSETLERAKAPLLPA